MSSQTPLTSGQATSDDVGYNPIGGERKSFLARYGKILTVAVLVTGAVIVTIVLVTRANNSPDQGICNVTPWTGPQSNVPEPPNTFEEYLKRADDAYRWFDTGITYRGANCTFYVLNMTSQTWLTNDIWRYARPENANGNRWWHFVMVAIPDQLTRTDSAYLYITGGSNSNGNIPTATSDDATMLVELAVKIGQIGAVVYQVPNQPIIFANDPKNQSRTEDAIIAWGWEHVRLNPADTDWLVRLPMVKAAIRAMDTVTAFAKNKVNANLAKWIIAGASKRGWTTWLTSVFDKRVVASVPIVLDCLNFVHNSKHHYRAYAGWSFELYDYYILNFTKYLDQADTDWVLSIEDPYRYRNRMTTPRLVINAGNDEFFLPDDQRYFWTNMTAGEIYSFMVANSGHGFNHGDGFQVILKGVRAFMTSVLNNTPRPQFCWTHDDVNGVITLSTVDTPLNVTMWWAKSPVGVNRRDFRDAVLGPDQKPAYQSVPWYQAQVTQGLNGYWAGTAPRENSRWTAYFLEIFFPGPTTDSPPFRFTTTTGVYPETFPAAECHGEGCYGTLL